jgi:hypothetical protein
MRGAIAFFRNHPRHSAVYISGEGEGMDFGLRGCEGGWVGRFAWRYEWFA